MQCLKRKLGFCEWLTDVLDEQRCHPKNAHWINRDEGIFEVRWLNARSSHWTEADGELFQLWRTEGSRNRDKATLVHKDMKTNFRMNLASGKFEELTKFRETKGQNAKRCYRIVKAKSARVPETIADPDIPAFSPTTTSNNDDEIIKRWVDFILEWDVPWSPGPVEFTQEESHVHGGPTCTMHDQTVLELLKNGEENDTFLSENRVNPIVSNSNSGTFNFNSTSSWSANEVMWNDAASGRSDNVSYPYSMCLNQDCDSFPFAYLNQSNPNCSQGTLRFT